MIVNVILVLVTVASSISVKLLAINATLCLTQH